MVRVTPVPLCAWDKLPPTSCCTWPQHSKTEGAVPSWDNQLHPGGMKTSCPRVVEGPRMSPPQQAGQSREGWRRGSMPALARGYAALAPSAAQQQQPGPTSNMQFAPESNIHCSWEKPHPFSLAGFSFSYGSTQRASPCSCP